jgi:hypothetical protein
MSLLTIDWKPNLRTLRLFGWTLGLACFLAAAFAAWRSYNAGNDLSRPGSALFVGSAVLVMVGIFRPAWLRPLYLAWMGAAFPIGWLLSNVFLGIVFFVVFSSAGFLLRIVGRDPLRRKKPVDLDTYWIARKEERSAEDYFRQF